MHIILYSQNFKNNKINLVNKIVSKYEQIQTRNNIKNTQEINIFYT